MKSRFLSPIPLLVRTGTSRHLPKSNIARFTGTKTDGRDKHGCGTLIVVGSCCNRSQKQRRHSMVMWAVREYAIFHENCVRADRLTAYDRVVYANNEQNVHG